MMRILKFWQGKDPILVWQVQFKESKAKAYLVLDVRGTKPTAVLQNIKPDNLNPAGVIVSRIRKMVKSASLVAFKKDDTQGSFLITVGGKNGPIFHILAEAIRPPLLHLVSHDFTRSDARLSTKGSYTKAKDLEDKTATWRNALADLQLGTAEEQVEALEKQEALKPLVPSYQKELRQSIKRRLKTVKKSLAKLELPSKEALKEIEQQAHYLQTYGYLAQAGDDHLTLDPTLSGLEEPVHIPLDSELSIGKNIERLFQKVKRLSKKSLLGQRQQEELQDYMDRLTAAQGSTEKDQLSLEETLNLRQKLGLKSKVSPLKGQDAAPSVPYTSYSYEGHRLLVGKSAKDNDILTKQAKANDYWCHIIGPPGSHIIIPSQKEFREALPIQLKRAGAILALHFSKLRQDQKGEVYVTKKSHLKKKRGMPAGLWLVERSESFYISYTQEELKAILDQKIY